MTLTCADCTFRHGCDQRLIDCVDGPQLEYCPECDTRIMGDDQTCDNCGWFNSE